LNGLITLDRAGSVGHDYNPVGKVERFLIAVGDEQDRFDYQK
jgi:hypothetical protein